jgi:hypothetical protein
MPHMEGASGDTGTGFAVALWLPAGVIPPPRLVQALTGKRVKIDQVTSPYAALAAMCRASRAAREARAASSLALIVVHPEQQPDARLVVESAAKYAPGIRCWMFGPASNPRLRAIVESDVAAWGGSTEREPEIVVRPRPSEVEARPIPMKAKTAPTDLITGRNLRGSRRCGWQGTERWTSPRNRSMSIRRARTRAGGRSSLRY